MSGKPDDIPQDIWDTASRMALEYRQWVEGGNTTASLSDHAEEAMADTIARAILAERERCVKLADSYIDPIDIAHFIRTGGVFDVNADHTFKNREA